VAWMSAVGEDVVETEAVSKVLAGKALLWVEQVAVEGKQVVFVGREVATSALSQAYPAQRKSPRDVV
jgi:hypothetical protein